ncbi:MAG: HPF/RaiA family ribosome-associated protein [DPANN group archaeon]|nr:HPF/RaiA family ribosome-associated protein [DPANN group archaeon]
MVSADTIIKKPKNPLPAVSSKIHISGVENMKPFQQAELETIMNKVLAKLDKTYGNIKEFKCYVKTFETTGKTKYSIHLYLVVPGSSFTAEQADFDFNAAVSWAAKALEKEVLRAKEKHKYQTGKGVK